MNGAGVVIVGAGQAGFQTAASLREAGFSDPITIIGDEQTLPYQRPPLSKAYLAGKTDAEDLLLRPASYLDEHRIVHRRARATGIDRVAKHLGLDDDTDLPYDHLVLATGSRNRVLPVPGAELPGVYQLRSLDDADLLRAAIEAANTVVVVGAGFIGLEFAAVCTGRGLAVTVIEAADRTMARAVSLEISRAFRSAHEAMGVAFLFQAGVTAIEGRDGRVAAVVTADGERIPADLVLVGIGVVPNHELAERAGLPVCDGIETDAFLSTGDPAISAIGDCARFPTRFAAGMARGDRVRIESVQNAIDQARCLAGRLVGRPTAYEAVPWFWSDQGRHKLQIAGLSEIDDRSVVRGSGEAFSVFRFRNDRLRAVESLNRPADHMAARRILMLGLDLTSAQASDPGFDLKGWATASR